jgi:hypothetical protein
VTRSRPIRRLYDTGAGDGRDRWYRKSGMDMAVKASVVGEYGYY